MLEKTHNAAFQRLDTTAQELFDRFGGDKDKTRVALWKVIKNSPEYAAVVCDMIIAGCRPAKRNDAKGFKPVDTYAGTAGGVVPVVAHVRGLGPTVAPNKPISFIKHAGLFETMRVLDGRLLGDLYIDELPDLVRKSSQERDLLLAIMKHAQTPAGGNNRFRVKDVVTEDTLASLVKTAK